MAKKWSQDIRFYLYPLEMFPSFWGPNSTCDHSKRVTPKHDAYIYAIQAMKRHPWRTSNPDEAMIAVLPLSLDVLVRGGSSAWEGGGCPGLGSLFSDVGNFMSVISRDRDMHIISSSHRNCFVLGRLGFQELQFSH